jgi:beta-galactosidase
MFALFKRHPPDYAFAMMKLLQPTAVFLGIATLAQASIAADIPRSRESFNDGWRFERFGPMPDRSTRPEPGSPHWVYQLTASSEENGKGNFASQAMDGSSGTRWCASGPGAGQWLQIDLGKPADLTGIEVSWERDGQSYEFKVETSQDGQNWTKAFEGKSQPQRIPFTAKASQVRITATQLPQGAWASIREVALIDNSGKVIKNEQISGGQSPKTADFDDSSWRAQPVPHDWGIEGPFREDLDNNTGKLPWQGIGWYRKHFKVDAADQGKRFFIDFDGAMANATVWVNGEHIGGWPYGYNPFRLEMTRFLRFGADNVIAVRLDTVNWGSRWYPGAGLYRNVWLVKTSPVHVAQWGVYITTPKIEASQAEAQLEVTVDNQSEAKVGATVAVSILEMEANGHPGKEVAHTEPQPLALDAKSTAAGKLSVSVPNPRLWDIATPTQYVARVSVKVDGKEVDQYDQPFGFRSIEFTARDGFKLNGHRVQLQGTCNHHDLGSLGAAVNDRAMERQLEILKEMGCNALRTSHNPPAPEWLELADRMGFVVMVEAFDCWQDGKTANDYSKLYEIWHEKDLRAMVRRERNHPSVILWSIGNEIGEQADASFSKPLHDIVHSEDPTRPVTAGCNRADAGINEFRTGVDVFGLNYNLGWYPKILSHPGNENKPVYTSESSSCISSRGEYFFPIKRGAASEVNFQVSSYDVDAPPWAQTPDEVFAALDKNPAFMGEFVWTGFDYIGEPTPYNNDVSNLLNFSDPEQRAALKKQLDELGRIKVPSASSYFGIVDLCGFKKDRFYAYQARWRSDLPMAHIFPHWNWPEREGQVTPVHVYTSGDEAELFLNGKSLGKKKKGQFEYRLRWEDVVYTPGELKVVAYRNGKEWAIDTVTTTGPASKLLAAADHNQIKADSRDLSFITITVADKDNLMVPRTHNLVKFTIEGPGEIAAVGNGDAASHEPFQASQRSAYNGLCQVIVRAKKGQPGKITLTAAAEGLAPASVVIESQP